MSLDVWIAFCFAATLVLIVPGPTIILVMSQTLVHGRKAVLPLTVGVALGDFTAMGCSLIGLGAVLAASALFFTILKWCGAVYLIFLGLKVIFSRPENRAAADEMQHAARANGGNGMALFQRAYIVTSLNPKSMVFFLAFMPQFVSRESDPAVQFVLLGATFLLLATVNAACYGMFAGQMGEIMHNTKVRRIFEYFGGGALIGAGLLTAAVSRSQ